jgi:hypothetical protein
MKTFHLNLQNKGGAGKSMLTYLQALKHRANVKAAFVDLDNSTKTSARQLQFLEMEKDSPDALVQEIENLRREKNMSESVEPVDTTALKAIDTKISVLENQLQKYKGVPRLFDIGIYDELKRIDREKFFEVAQALSERDFDEVFIDFGAAESEQFLHLFKTDFSIEELKEFEAGIGVKFIFNVIVAGSAAYQSCCDYLSELLKSVKNRFTVKVYANMHYFYNETSQLDALKKYCNDRDLQMAEFGAFNTQLSSGQAILELVKTGKGMDFIRSFAAKTILKRSLAALE